MSQDAAPPRPLHPKDLNRVLDTVLDHVEHLVIPDDFRVVGTAASVLYGVELPAYDLDILAKRRHVVDDFAWGLQRYPCEHEPSVEDGSTQYFSRFLVNDIPVEISTVEADEAPDGIETYGEGPWLHYVMAPCGSRQAPAVALELRLATEVYRNRPDRFEPILAWMREHGYDTDLLRMALAARGVPEEQQMELLNSLTTTS